MKLASGLEQRRQNLTNNIRNQHLNHLFTKIRSETIRDIDRRQLSSNREHLHATVQNIVNNIVNGVEESIYQLYEHCAYYTYTHLNQNHIQSLTREIKLERVTEQEIIIIITMISNWAVIQLDYRLDHSQLFCLLLRIAHQKPYLSQQIVYALINLHKSREHSSLLLSEGLIEVVLGNLSRNNNSFQEVSSLFKNILRTTESISSGQFRMLLEFLGRALQECVWKETIRENCVAILISLFSISNSKNSHVIFHLLQKNLKKLILAKLMVQDPLKSSPTFQLIAKMYQVPTLSDSWLISADFCLSLWELMKPFLYNPDLQHRNFWTHLQYFLTANFEGKEKIYSELTDLCLKGEATQWQEYILPLLVNYLHPQQLFQFVSEKIGQFQPLEQITLAMLTALLKAFTSKEPILKDWLTVPLKTMLRRLSYDDRQEIAQLAQEVREHWEQLMEGKGLEMQVEWI